MERVNQLDAQYQDLLQYIIENGVKKQTRNGEVLSIFGYQILHNMKRGFPLLTTKKMAWKQIVTELMWFLRGDTNIKYLIDNNCHIWNGDAIKNYEKHNSEIDWGKHITKEEAFLEAMKDDEFAKKWGDLGPIYGKQWRDWKYIEQWNTGNYFTKHFDQIQNLISELKTNPDSRRLMVSAWNVGELHQMVLPPCHYGFQVWTRELSDEERYDLIEKDKHIQFVKWQDLGTNRIKEVLDEKNVPKRAISLMWNQRSVDTFLGLPFNIASYGLLLEILAKAVNMMPEELIGNLGDVHLYSNHIEQAKEQISRTPYPLPQLEYINPTNVQGLYLDVNAFQIKKYQYHPTIKAPLSN